MNFSFYIFSFFSFLILVVLFFVFLFYLALAYLFNNVCFSVLVVTLQIKLKILNVALPNQNKFSSSFSANIYILFYFTLKVLVI